MNILKSLTAASALFVALACIPSRPAYAGPAGDELSKCMLQSATDEDRANLVRWIFSSAAANPDVADIASVTDEQRTDMSKNVASLFERLLTQDCVTQFRSARQGEGEQALGASFGTLVQAAMESLISDPAVTKALGGVNQQLDKSKISAALQGP